MAGCGKDGTCGGTCIVTNATVCNLEFTGPKGKITLLGCWALYRHLRNSYGCLRLDWISHVWPDFNARAAVFRRSPQSCFFQHAAPRRSRACETAAYLPRREQG